MRSPDEWAAVALAEMATVRGGRTVVDVLAPLFAEAMDEAHASNETVIVEKVARRKRR